MRIAFVSDIHGNLPALEAAVRDIASQPVDLIVNPGDLLSGAIQAGETSESARIAEGNARADVAYALRTGRVPGETGYAQ